MFDATPAGSTGCLITGLSLYPQHAIVRRLLSTAYHYHSTGLFLGYFAAEAELLGVAHDRVGPWIATIIAFVHRACTRLRH